MRNTLHKVIWLGLGIVVGVPLFSYAVDWYEASGVPAQRSLLSSSDLRSEFAAIETNISDKLPVLTGNGGKIIRVNSAETALEAASTGIAVSEGGTGATTLTGVVVGNGTSTFTASTSSTVGEVLRVSGANSFAFGPLNLADGDAIQGDLPDASLSSNVALLDTGGDFTATISVNGSDVVTQSDAGAFKFKSADETVNGSATLQDDDDLQGFTLEADTLYELDWVLMVDTAAAADFKYSLAFSNAPQSFDQRSNPWGWSTATTGSLSEGGGLLEHSVVNAVFKTNASTGGTLKLQWAQANSDASDTTVKAGSSMRVRKLVAN